MVPYFNLLHKASLLLVAVCIMIVTSDATVSVFAATPAVISETPRLTPVITSAAAVETGKKTLFDATESQLLPGVSVLPLFRWNFGDGTPPVIGAEALHAYAKPGRYTVQLRVSHAGIVSEIERDIFAFDRRAVLVTDDPMLATNQLFARQAAESGVLLTVIAAREGETGFLTEEYFLQRMQEESDSITAANLLIFQTRASVGIQAFTRYVQAVPPAIHFDPGAKLFIKISSDNFDVSEKIAKQAFDVIRPRFVLLTRPEALVPLLGMSDSNQLTEVLTARGIEYRIVDDRSRASDLYILSHLVSMFVAHGIPSNIIYLLIAFPFIAFFISFFRQVIGGPTFGVYAPAVLALALLMLGLPVGLFALGVVLAVSLLVRVVLTRLELLYIPRVALLFSCVALSLFGVVYTLIRFGSATAVSLAVFPMLVMSTISEKFVAAQAEEGLRGALLGVTGTIAIAISSYYVLAWPTFTNVVLSFPELVLVPLLGSLLLGRFTGLRLSEYVRFRSLFFTDTEE